MQEQVVGLYLMLGLSDEFEAHFILLIDVLGHSSRKVPLYAIRRRSQEKISSFLSLKRKSRNFMEKKHFSKHNKRVAS